MATPPAAPGLPVAGLIGNSTSTLAISPEDATGAAYLPHSDVLRLAGGSLHYLPEGADAPRTAPATDSGAAAAVAATRGWLAAGTVPGRSVTERDAAARALLDLRLLGASTGGVPVAAWYGIWKYIWPRDAAWTTAAFTVTGHRAEAYRTLRFLAEVQRPDGTWEARYHPDGTPVRDGREWQLDGNGWVPWAAWLWLSTAPASAAGEAAELWPMVRTAADHAADCLDSRGLPPASPDYYELPTPTPNLGTAGPLLAGLRAASDHARHTGSSTDAARYTAAAERLATGIADTFAANGFSRTLEPHSGIDSAVTFLAPPFQPRDPAVYAALDHAEQVLVLPSGGVVPGLDWLRDHDDGFAWTPETGFLALARAAGGDTETANHWLRWLLDHRTSLGVLPEKVDAAGRPASVAPLGFTAAIVLLALTARDHGLPIPPAR